MDLDEQDLPRIQTSAAGMNQEPMPVTEDLLGSVKSAEQAVNTPTTTMKKGWNRCPTRKKGGGTDDPRKGGMGLLGFR